MAAKRKKSQQLDMIYQIIAAIVIGIIIFAFGYGMWWMLQQKGSF
jgi:hypothetical protein